MFTMMQPHRQLLYFMLLYISNSLVSTSLVGHVLNSADLMSTICFPHLFLMVHRYIYSRYSSVFSMLYQLYHSLPSSTLISSSSLYLSVATWVASQSCNRYLDHYCKTYLVNDNSCPNIDLYYPNTTTNIPTPSWTLLITPATPQTVYFND